MNLVHGFRGLVAARQEHRGEGDKSKAKLLSSRAVPFLGRGRGQCQRGKSKGPEAVPKVTLPGPTQTWPEVYSTSPLVSPKPFRLTQSSLATTDTELYSSPR